MSGSAVPTTERIATQSDDPAPVVESVNANEIATANDAIDSFNSQLQSKADILGIDVANVSAVDEVQAETVPEAHAEADRLRADADDREAAIFNRIVEVINKADIANVSEDEVQTPADARALADELEGQGVLPDQAAQSLRDAADLVENDLKPSLNNAADKLDALGPDPEIGTVDGTVTDADGDAIANATVSVGNETATTDANGTYAIELEPGDYELAVSADGYETASRNVTVEADATTTVDVTLESADGAIEGIVTNTAGEPIANATVTVGERETTTAADGSYAVDVEAGDYTLSVSAEGYVAASEDVTVAPGETAIVDVTLEESTGSIEGTVTDADGNAVAGATVTVGERETTTGDDGSFAVELTPGQYTLAVSAEGYEDVSQDVTVEADATTTVDVTLEPVTGTIEGTVTNADGEPIANATITADESVTTAAIAGDRQTTTDKNGSYSLELEQGEYTLSVSAAGYEDASQAVTVEADATTTVDVSLEEATGTVDGTVADTNGEPVADATVMVGDQQTTTDADGNFTLELAPGEYTLSVSAEGYVAASEDVTVAAGETTTVDVALESADGTVEGTVTDAGGSAVTDATVTVGDKQTTTDQNGSYAIDLEPGEYELAVSAEGYESASRNVTVEAGATTTVDVTLEANVTDPIAEVVEEVNANEIAETNDEIEAFNEKIDEQAPDGQAQTQADAEQFDDVELVEPVEATTDAEAVAEAERLREGADDRQAAIFDTLVEVINARAPDIVSPILEKDDVTTPEEARAEGKRIEEEYGDIDDAKLANESLHDAADLVEFTVQPNLNGAADKLENVSDPEPTTGTLEGTVTDAAAEPIANATVEVGDQQTTTDENGSFALEVESGDYTLAVSAEGYEDASQNATVEAGATTTVEVTLTEESVAPDADVIVDATVDEERVAVGETVTVDVTIENATGDAETQFIHDDETEVDAYTLVLRYDSDALEFTGIDRPHWQVVDIPSDGILVVDRAWVPPGQNEMPVDAFTAEFEVVDGAGDDATVEFDSTASSVEERVFLWKTQPLDAEYDGATVAIEAPDEGDDEAPNPEPSPDPEPNPNPSPEPNPNPVEYPDSISVIWDAIIGFGSEFVGIDSSASPIGGGHGFAASR